MIKVPIILMMLLGMALFGLVAFAYEYGKQMRELKSLRKQLKDKALELQLQRYSNYRYKDWQYEVMGDRYGGYKEQLDPAIYKKKTKK